MASRPTWCKLSELSYQLLSGRIDLHNPSSRPQEGSESAIGVSTPGVDLRPPRSNSRQRTDGTMRRHDKPSPEEVLSSFNWFMLS